MEYKVSKGTAQYLDAIRLLDEATEIVVRTTEEIYGKDELAKDYTSTITEAREDVFDLIAMNMNNELGDLSQRTKDSATI